MEKTQIIVYDFDKTIYGGETSLAFYLFYFRKKPLKMFWFSICYVKDVFLYLVKYISLKILKERFYEFLTNENIDEIEELMKDFWQTQKHKIYPWVESEVIENKKIVKHLIAISASPLFLIDSLLKTYGFTHVIGTDFLIENNKFIPTIIGENCKGIEKVKKLNIWAEKEKLSYEIHSFYSDSLADKPLFDLAKKTYWIKKGKKIEGIPSKKTIIDKLFWK